jgi:uncharacterized protein (TIGR02145 family)
MKCFIKITVIVFLSAGILQIMDSCKKEKTLTLPVLSTVIVSGITQTGAVSGGNITSDGGASVTDRGVCWSASTNPAVTGTHTTDGTGTGSFASNLTGLSSGTTYYVRAYATNSVGTAYGNEVSFATNPPVLATLTTTAPSSITATTTVSGGEITSDGNGTITARGVCWGTVTDPTVTDSHTTDGTGTGSFTSNLTGLSAATTYYVRAYATNSAGTAYGNQVSFNTMLVDIDGNLYKIVTIGAQVWMAENLKTTKFNNNTAIPLVTDNTAWSNLATPGYCWYNNEITNKDIYGAIYNWYTAYDINLCPTGWHAPTDAEWHQLILFIDPGATLTITESQVAGGKLKESGTTHWQTPNTGATDETGFTALPGGDRDINGAYNRVGTSGKWWCSDNTTARYRDLEFNVADVLRVSSNGKNGYSVRCIKNQ